MFDVAARALSDLLSPPFRAVLLKSMGLAVLLLVAAVIGLQRLFAWLSGAGATWVETSVPGAHMPLSILSWVLAIAAALGLIVGAVFLMPMVTALVASLFGDEAAEQVERSHYPATPVGVAVPVGRALVEGIKIALLSLVVYLCAVPFLFFAGFGFVIFFVATAYLQSRQFFELAAMRYHPVAEAKRLRRAHQGTVFLAGLMIAAFISIPVVNLAAPLFGTALMVHLHKRLMGTPPQLIEPRA